MHLPLPCYLEEGLQWQLGMCHLLLFEGPAMEHTINGSRGWAFMNDKALGFRQGLSGLFFLSNAITLHFSSGI